MGGSKSAGPSPTSPIGSAAAAAAFSSAKSLDKRPNLRVVPPKQDEESRKSVREMPSDALSRNSSRTSSNDTSLSDLMIARLNSPGTPQHQYRLWFRKKTGGPATSLIVQPGELVDDIKTRILQKYPTSLQQRIDPADLVLTVPKASGIRLELQPDELVTQVIDDYFNGNMKMSDALEIGPPVAFWNPQWGGGSSSSANNSVCGQTPVSQTPGLFSNNATPTLSTPGAANIGGSDSRGSRTNLQRARSFGQWLTSPPFLTTGNGPMGISNGGGAYSGNSASSNNGGVGFPFPSSYGNYSNAYNHNNGGNAGAASPSHTSGFNNGGSGTKPNTPSSETGKSPAPFNMNHTPSVASMPSLGSGAASTVGGDSRSNSSVNISVPHGDFEPETTVLLMPRPQPVTSKPLNRNSNAAALAAANAAAGSSISNTSVEKDNGSSSKPSDNAGGAIATHSGFDYDSIDYSKWKLTSKQDDLPKGTVVPQIKILIVEDNRINQQILERFLKKKNVQFEVAQTGREALDKWKTGEFHLILMDIQLPVMTGLEATQEIRRLEAVNGIGAFQQGSADVDNASLEPHDVIRKSAGGFRSPVIIVALTASSDSDDLTEALAAGCNDFLTKPVNFAWLERKIIEWGCMQALIDFEGWKSWNVEEVSH